MRRNRERKKDKAKKAKSKIEVAIKAAEPIDDVWAVTYRRGNFQRKAYATGKVAKEAELKVIKALGRNTTATIVRTVPILIDQQGKIQEACAPC